MSDRSGFKGSARELEREVGGPRGSLAVLADTMSACSAAAGSVYRLMCILGVLLFILFPEAIRADPQVVEETEYYEIQGSTFADLRSQIRMQGPKGYSGYTKWNMRYQFRTRAESGGCIVTAVSVIVRIHYIMPRWSNGLQASTTLQGKWHKYYSCLKAHETNHKEIAVRNGQLLEQRLLGMRSSSCKALDAQCHEVAQSFFEQTRRENAEYDQQTNHGKDEGCR